MRTFSRTESARLLGISVRTLGRWVADGRITAERSGTEQFAELRIGLDELQRIGLFIEPEPEPEPSMSSLDIEPQPELGRAELAHPQPQPTKPLNPIEERRQADLQYAAEFLAGRATDSYGNKFGRTLVSDSGKIVTALGPLPPQRRAKPSTTSHMDSRLIGDTTQPSADSPLHPLNRDFKPIETKQSPEHPNAPRQRALLVTLEECLRAARMGYSR